MKAAGAASGPLEPHAVFAENGRPPAEAATPFNQARDITSIGVAFDQRHSGSCAIGTMKITFDGGGVSLHLPVSAMYAGRISFSYRLQGSSGQIIVSNEACRYFLSARAELMYDRRLAATVDHSRTIILHDAGFPPSDWLTVDPLAKDSSDRHVAQARAAHLNLIPRSADPVAATCLRASGSASFDERGLYIYFVRHNNTNVGTDVRRNIEKRQATFIVQTPNCRIEISVFRETLEQNWTLSPLTAIGNFGGFGTRDGDP